MLFALLIVPANRIEHSSLLGFTIFTWALTDAVRYPFYALNLYRKCPLWLKQMRYTNFLVQYPLNVLAENLYVFLVLFPACVSRGALLRLRIPIIDMYVHYGYVYVVSKVLYDNLRFPTSFKSLWYQMQMKLKQQRK